MWQRLSVELFKGVAYAIEPRTTPIFLEDDFGGAPCFEFKAPKRPASLATPTSLPSPQGSHYFLVSPTWFNHSTQRDHKIPNTNPWSVLLKFLDNKSLTSLCRLSKSVLANVFHSLPLRRQDHFGRKASQREVVFGDPKFSHLPLLNFFDNFKDLFALACVNKKTHELLLPLPLTHSQFFYKKYVLGLHLAHPIPVGGQLQMLSRKDLFQPNWGRSFNSVSRLRKTEDKA